METPHSSLYKQEQNHLCKANKESTLVPFGVFMVVSLNPFKLETICKSCNEKSNHMKYAQCVFM